MRTPTMVMQMVLPRKLTFAAFVLGVFGLAVGCGDRDGDLGTGGGERLQISPAAVSFSRVPVGQSARETVTMRNTGDDSLQIYEMKLKAREGANIEAISLKNLPSKGEFSIPAEDAVEVEVEYKPTESGQRTAGVIEVRSSDPTYVEGEVAKINITTLGNQPRLDVSPPSVRFPRLSPGDSLDQTVRVQNLGSAPLKIYEAPSISGSESYTAELKEQRDYPVTLQPAGDGGDGLEEVEVVVTYRPREGGSDSAELIFKSNEEPGSTPDDPTINRVKVAANAESPCILVDGTTRNLGAVPLGGSTTELLVVENCGTKTLEISGFQLVENSEDDEFEVDLGERDGNGDGTLDEPVTLEPGSGRTTFAVEYTPIQAGSDQATVVIESNDPVQPELEVDLVGRGSEGACPKTDLRAKVKGVSAAPRQSVTAAPLDYIILDGSETTDEDGTIEEWSWKVLKKPEDVTVNLEPLDSDTDDENPEKRQFRLLTAGTYKIGLTVKDNDGFTSCEQAVATISAVPNEKVHVELTWTNPEDPDETDDTGSDVDVHMVKMGPGQWFKAPYDIYFRNPNNGSATPGAGIWQPENPSLDIDDTDGAGPENIQMDDPQACQWYAVGVHYYKQLFGTAYATVRIYINSKLVYEKLNIPLRRGGQFMDVARIHWPTGQVFDVGSRQPAPPVDEKPAVTESMASSELCTAEKLY